MKQRLNALSAISVRISLIFSILTLLILLIMGIVIHQLVTQHFETEDRILLTGKIALINHLLEEHPENQALLINKIQDAHAGHVGLVLHIERPIGTTLFNSTNTPISSSMDNRDATLTTWQIDQQPYHGLIVTQPSSVSAPSHRIVIGVNTSEHERFLNQFRQQLLVIGSLGTVTIMILGWLIARRGLRPAQSMARIAEGISAKHLTERLDVDQAPAELKPLATAFNDMLDRLASAVSRLEDFSSDLAHELRTPVNTLMTQTQVSLSKTRDVSTYQDVLFSNLEEYERLARIIADMLFLAKAEHALSLPRLQCVDLAHEVTALFEFYEIIALDKDMLLSQSGAAVVQGDQLMLRRALSNLIANAIRYGLPSTPVMIQLHQDEQVTTLTIQNQAPTLSSAQLSRLFDRFYRTDLSRQRGDENSGLGLAITQTIVHAHGGTIMAFSERDTVTFKITFSAPK